MNKIIKNLNIVSIILILLTLLIVVYLITGLNNKRYYSNYPTLYLYPNNENELKVVKEYNNKRLNNKEIDDFVKLCDESISSVFIKYADYISINDIKEIDYSNSSTISSTIYYLKRLFNRQRPFNVDKEYDNYKTNTTRSPSFPSGHSAQAQFFAKKLSKKYPDKKKELYEIAERIGMSRIYAGVHYPSDHKFSKFFVQFIP